MICIFCECELPDDSSHFCEKCMRTLEDATRVLNELYKNGMPPSIQEDEDD